MTAVGILALQSRPPATLLDMVVGASAPTLVVLAVLGVFSLASWYVIGWKYLQFRKVQSQGNQFLDAVSNARGLEEAYTAILTLPESPYGRLFRHGVNFFSELRPGALREGVSEREGLTQVQLETLRLVLQKEESDERDDLAHGLTWLAVIGSISPLLGLMGTVIGIMNTFRGITVSGSANIAAVAPGVAEALVTTVTGLFVAIPAVIAYNYYVSRLNLVAGELEGFSSEFIGTLAREGHV